MNQSRRLVEAFADIHTTEELIVYVAGADDMLEFCRKLIDTFDHAPQDPLIGEIDHICASKAVLPGALFVEVRKVLLALNTFHDANRDHYEVLGLASGASQDTIKKAYRELSKEYHPDRNNHPDDGGRRFMEISGAYHALMTGFARKRVETPRKWRNNIPHNHQDNRKRDRKIFFGLTTLLVVMLIGVSLFLAARYNRKAVISQFSNVDKPVRDSADLEPPPAASPIERAAVAVPAADVIAPAADVIAPAVEETAGADQRVSLITDQPPPLTVPDSIVSATENIHQIPYLIPSNPAAPPIGMVNEASEPGPVKPVDEQTALAEPETSPHEEMEAVPLLPAAELIDPPPEAAAPLPIIEEGGIKTIPEDIMPAEVHHPAPVGEPESQAAEEEQVVLTSSNRKMPPAGGTVPPDGPEELGVEEGETAKNESMLPEKEMTPPAADDFAAIREFIEQYTCQYNDRRLSSFLALFTEDATENGNLLKGTADQYRSLFTHTQKIDLAVVEVQCSELADGYKASGKLRAAYTYKDGTTSRLNGSITFHIVQEDGTFKISALEYDFQD